MTASPAADPRLTPANGRVADISLKGRVTAERFTAGHPARVSAPVADLLAEPGGRRERQLLHGWPVTVYEERAGHAFLRSERDGYVGHVATSALGPLLVATHLVAARATHLYTAPDIKSPERAHLSFGALLSVTGTEGAFARTAEGFVPQCHLRPCAMPLDDPVAVARMHLGVPYLWGGNSVLGIDCSGLVQAALMACGIACPGDSDLQERGVGTPLIPAGDLRAGDLVFWRGHVGLMADDVTLIHANATHMAVVAEPLATARSRILALTGHDITSCRRP
ncbi:MAG: C40 family peptidase [Rubellimicrobium sp.]|nr:C40 family peptidase [Rubellimicrobium sp.]